MALQSCGDDTDFTVNKDDCASFDIISGNSQITIVRDTAWSIQDGEGRVVCPADINKIEAFFNVLRDIQVMGMSQRDASAGFDCEVVIHGRSGREIKNLRFAQVPGSANMIGSSDGGKCYVVGVPGLNQNPIVDFQPGVEYWKDKSLLLLSADNISKISIENFIDPSQTFFVETNVNDFAVRNSNGDIVPIPQSNIKSWLGSISGIYRASEYTEGVQLMAQDLIYRLKTRNRIGICDSILFYKKYLPDGKPDFNKMYFQKGTDIGTAKYYDFDKVLMDLDRLKK